MRKYNIVTSWSISQLFKQDSKYFKVNLGVASTMESKTGDRLLNMTDSFAYFYNTTYKTTILCQGNIGDILVYTDHYIKNEEIAFYYDKEEFIFKLDKNIINEKGIDFYLGYLIKNAELLFQERSKKEKEEIDIKKKEVGNADNIINNPGGVKYADIKAYLDKKNAERLKS